jgi:hypothetical protein
MSDIADAGEPTVAAGFGWTDATLLDAGGTGESIFEMGFCTTVDGVAVTPNAPIIPAAGVDAMGATGAPTVGAGAPIIGTAAVAAAAVAAAAVAAAAVAGAVGAVAAVAGVAGVAGVAAAAAAFAVVLGWLCCHTIIKLKPITNNGKNKIPHATISAPLWESKSINKTLINPISAC